MSEEDSVGSFGCEPCSMMLRWGDIYHQAILLTLLWVSVSAGGFGCVCFVRKTGFQLSDRLKLRLCEWESVCSTNLALASYMVIFHIVQCILFVERSYSARVLPYYSVIEIVMSFVYFIEVFVWFLVGTLYGDFTRWSRIFRSLFLDIFLLAAPFARVIVVDGYQSWFSFTFLAGFRCARVLKRYVELNRLESTSVISGVSYVVFLNLCGVFSFAAIIMVFELLDGPYEDIEFNRQSLEPNRHWGFFATVYYLIGTIATVGYGDYVPKSFFGRIFSILIILGGLALFTAMINQMHAIYIMSQNGFVTYRPKHKKHVVVLGRPTAECVQDFVLELFHADHIEDARVYDVCVMLLNVEDVKTVKSLVETARWHLIRERVTILQGSPLDWRDCERAMLSTASCIFVFPDFNALNPASDDGENVIRMISLRRTHPTTRIVGLLHEAKQKPFLLASGFAPKDVTVLEEFRYNCIGKACGGVPGFTPFISNLIKSIGQNQEFSADEGCTWQREYQQGYGHEMYEVQLEYKYVDVPFRIVFGDILQRADEHDVYLIGIVNPDDTICLNPGQDFIIEHGGRGVILASSRSSIKQCGKCDMLIQLRCLDFNTMFTKIDATEAAIEAVAEIVSVMPIADTQKETTEIIRPAGFRDCIHSLLIDGKVQLDMLHLAYTIGSGEPRDLPKEKIVLPVIPDGELPKNFRGNHILFCSSQPVSVRWGLDIVIRPLKHKMTESEKPPILVVLAPTKPPEWETLDICKYYFQGSPLNLFDLERAMYLSARKIVIMHPASRGNSIDNEVIYVTRFIEAALGEHGTVVTELAMDSHHVLLPLGHTETAPRVGASSTMQQKRARHDLIQGSLAAEEAYYENARFAQGNLIIAGRVLTSLMANSLFSPSLPALALALCEKRFFVAPVPSKWDQTCYRDFLNFLMTKELLAVGLYRMVDSSAHDTGARGYMGLIRHGYMFSCPPMTTLIKRTDKVLCLVHADN